MDYQLLNLSASWGAALAGIFTAFIGFRTYLASRTAPRGPGAWHEVELIESGVQSFANSPKIQSAVKDLKRLKVVEILVAQHVPSTAAMQLGGPALLGIGLFLYEISRVLPEGFPIYRSTLELITLCAIAYGILWVVAAMLIVPMIERRRRWIERFVGDEETPADFRTELIKFNSENWPWRRAKLWIVKATSLISGRLGINQPITLEADTAVTQSPRSAA